MREERRSNEAEEFFLGQAGLIQDGEEGAFGNVLALGNDHKTHFLGEILSDKCAVTSFAPVRGFAISLSDFSAC